MFIDNQFDFLAALHLERNRFRLIESNRRKPFAPKGAKTKTLGGCRTL